MCYESVTKLFGTPVILPDTPASLSTSKNIAQSVDLIIIYRSKERFPDSPSLENSVQKAASHHREHFWNSRPPIVVLFLSEPSIKAR